MKKFYILIVVLLMNILCIYAQPSLTLATHGYVPGDVYSYYYGDTTGFNPGAGGANTTWTFTGWTITPNLKTINYVDPATTPYASSFTTSTYAYEMSGSYFFYKLISAGTYCMGYASTVATIPYSPYVQLYAYPFTYLTTKLDYFSGTDTIAGVKYKRNGQVTTTGDGWGKLTINGGTYNNVLRVKTVEILHYFEIRIPPVIPTDTLVGIEYKTVKYQWYWQNSKYPLINYSAEESYGYKTPGVITTKKEIFVDNTVTAINDNRTETMNFAIYPNPGKGIINLESEFSGPQQLNIEIINTNGQVVYSDVINVKTGILNQAIDVSTLPQGIYSVKIFNNESFGIRKLILQ